MLLCNEYLLSLRMMNCAQLYSYIGNKILFIRQHLRVTARICLLSACIVVLFYSKVIFKSIDCLMMHATCKV